MEPCGSRVGKCAAGHRRSVENGQRRLLVTGIIDRRQKIFFDKPDGGKGIGIAKWIIVGADMGLDGPS